MALRTEINSPRIERDIREVWIDSREGGEHGAVQLDFEHGQWWVTCLACGAQYSVCDAAPGDFCFEQISIGDEEAH